MLTRRAAGDLRPAAELTGGSSPQPTRSTSRRSSSGSLAGRVFEGLSRGAGILILVVLAAVAIFLIVEAWPALTATREQLSAVSWIKGQSFWSYLGPLIFGTLMASILALLIAVPVSIGVALFISHYAPRRLAQGLGYLIDLLAAIPSVVYGLWGALVLLPVLDPFMSWLSSTLGFIPLFADYQAPARNILSASIVLAVMILPIITAVSREVFLQTPRLHEEAAMALGATRWEVVRMAVLPFGRSGVVSAAMLGLGRALGETMAVLMVLSPGFLYSFFLLKPGQQQTIAANIASKFPEASGLAVNALVATGLALFVITFAVNMVARWITSRNNGSAGSD